MPSGFRVSVQLDEGDKLILFSIRGEISSQALTDELIEAHPSVDKIWEYHRLFDYRHATGLYEYDDVKRLKAWWVAQKPASAPVRKCAIVSPDPLTRARINTFDPSLLVQDENRAFESMDEALDWVTGR